MCVCGLKRSIQRSELSWTNQNTNDRIISWEELREEASAAISHGARHRGCIFLSLLVSGLLGLNLLDALSAIIAERAQGRGADVTWSAGWRLGNYVGQLLDCLGIRKTRREVKEVEEEGGGETRGFSGDWRGGWVWRLEGVSVPWWRGKSSRGELLWEEAGQAGLTGSHQWDVIPLGETVQ